MHYKVPFIPQNDPVGCGTACLRMMFAYYQKDFTVKEVEEVLPKMHDGVSMQDLSNATETFGFKSLVVEVKFDILANKLTLPVIIFWRNYHFMVVKEISCKHIFINDPQTGEIVLTHDKFLRGWLRNHALGVCLLVEPYIKQDA